MGYCILKCTLLRLNKKLSVFSVTGLKILGSIFLNYFFF